MHGMMREAIDAATAKGAEYADVRVFRQRVQTISTSEMRVSYIADDEVLGFGVRVIVNGCWGFAGSCRIEKAEMIAKALQAVSIARAGSPLRGNGGVRLAPTAPAHGVCETPIEQDPFETPLGDKAGVLLAVAERLLAQPEIKKCHGYMQFRRTERHIASNEGADITDIQYLSGIGYQATAIGNHEARLRSFFCPPLSKGYELVTSTPLLANAERVAAEARELLHAPECPDGVMDVILDPSHLALTIHESVGHATELDRVLGMEESLAGRSFATTEKLGSFRYASPLVTFTANNQLPGGLATMGWDDDGVPASTWDIIKDGILIGYATNREVAPFIGEAPSHGCNRADHWGNIPIVRIPNLCLMPGKIPLAPDDLIADTAAGVYIDGTGSYSIDQMRLNFQFGGDVAWLVKNGKRQHMVKNAIYQGITPEFWGSCDAICDQRFWQPFGVTNCGKGDPGQMAMMTHGAAAARFRNVRVGGVKP